MSSRVTNMRDGEYRLLVKEVDRTRAVYAIAIKKSVESSEVEYLKEKLDARDANDDAQRALELHVGKYGLPKLGDRV